MAKTEKRKTGDIGEDVACIFLERKGFRIVERNYRKPWGEIDIVAEKDGIVRFVEVKSTSRDMAAFSRESYGYRPEEMATRGKLMKVARTAALYMETKKDRREYQIDVIAVLLDQEKRVAKCRFFEQALADNL
ncbi:MAG: YraN family protein [Patescibacteria group bacterium]